MPEANVAIEPWRKVWRQGLAPVLSDRALTALWNALAHDDQRLIQGATTEPPPLDCVQNLPCEGGCLVAFAGWQGEGLETVCEAEEFFARMCYEMDQRLGEPAGCRYLLNFWDETPRPKAIAALLGEVAGEMNRRRLPAMTPAVA